VKRTSIYAALALLALAAPAGAQGYDRGREPGVLPPHEIITMVSSTQFEPIGQPMRRGPNYLLRALDQYDREVTLTISARSGQIMAVTPMQTASRMPPPGEWQRVPPGYAPPPGYRRGAPIIDEDDEDLPPRVYGSRPPAPVPTAPPRAGQPAEPVASAMPPDDDDVQPHSGVSGPTVIPADPQPGGLLPPPPERFPQRVAPAAPPKPAQRAAAAPPKTMAPASAPLPRPKPAASASPAAAPSASAPAAVTQPVPAKKPVEETPH
jgi:hypothetical protein